MKKNLCVAILLLAMLLSACGGNNAKKEALQDYVDNDLQSLADMELAMLASYYSVSGVNYTDDRTMYKTLLEKTLPQTQELINAATNVSVTDSEIKEVHAQYISYANTLLSSFNLMLAALEQQDRLLITDANKELNEANEEATAFYSSLNALCEKYDVTIPDFSLLTAGTQTEESEGETSPTPAPNPEPTPSPMRTPTPTPIPTSTPTPTPMPTPTPTPTSTPVPTSTPTSTPEPTQTPVPDTSPESNSLSEKDEITFRGAKWWGKKAEVEESLGIEAKTYNERDSIYRMSGIDFAGTTTREDRVDGGGVTEYYPPLNVGGYTPSRMEMCYMFTIKDETIDRDSSEAEFYFGWYTFTSGDFVDMQSIFDDLAGKLENLYGQSEIDEQRYWTAKHWTDENGNVTRLVIGSENRYVTLGYMANGSEERLDAIQAVLDAEAAQAEDMLRQENQSNTEGL